MTPQPPPPERPSLISYHLLRTLLGTLGFLLPFVLPIGVYLFGPDGLDVFQKSISKYYHTNMSDVFVGVLWVFGLFLFTYKGYKTSTFVISDNLTTSIAGLLAVVVAIFPADYPGRPPGDMWIGIVHWICDPPLS